MGVAVLTEGPASVELQHQEVLFLDALVRETATVFLFFLLQVCRIANKTSLFLGKCC